MLSLAQFFLDAQVPSFPAHGSPVLTLGQANRSAHSYIARTLGHSGINSFHDIRRLTDSNLEPGLVL